MNAAEQIFAEAKRLTKELENEVSMLGEKNRGKIAQILTNRAELFDQLKSPDDAEEDRSEAKSQSNLLGRLNDVEWEVIAQRSGITNAL